VERQGDFLLLGERDLGLLDGLKELVAVLIVDQGVERGEFRPGLVDGSRPLDLAVVLMAGQIGVTRPVQQVVVDLVGELAVAFMRLAVTEVLPQEALHDPLVKVGPADEQALGRQHGGRLGAADLGHRQVERAAAEIEDQGRLASAQADVIGISGGDRLQHEGHALESGGVGRLAQDRLRAGVMGRAAGEGHRPAEQHVPHRLAGGALGGRVQLAQEEGDELLDGIHAAEDGRAGVVGVAQGGLDRLQQAAVSADVLLHENVVVNQHRLHLPAQGGGQVNGYPVVDRPGVAGFPDGRAAGVLAQVAAGGWLAEQVIVAAHDVQ